MLPTDVERKGPDVDTWLGTDSPMRRVLKLLDGHRKLSLTQGFASIMEGLLEAMILALVAQVGLEAIGGQPVSSLPLLGPVAIGTVLLLLPIAVFFRLAFGVVAPLVAAKISTSVTLETRFRLVDAYRRTSYLRQQELGEGQLQQLMVTYPQQIGATVGNLLAYLSNFIIMLAMLGLAFASAPATSAGLVITLIVLSLLFVPLRRRIRRLSRDLIMSQERSALAVDELANLRYEARAFGVGGRLAGRVEAEFWAESETRRRTASVKGLVSPFYVAVTYGAVTLGLAVAQGAASVELAGLAPVLLIILRSLSYGQSIQQASATIAAFGPLLDRVAAAVGRLEEQDSAMSGTAVRGIEGIELRSVKFRYPGSGYDSVSDVSVTLRRGDRIGIIGPSGSGKTTLTRLILGLLRPTEGDIFVNDASLGSVDESSFREQLGVVPQTPGLLRGTIIENVRFFRDEVDANQVAEALRLADLDSDLQKMPLGAETILGPGESELSGGQAQRLTVARALAGKPRLIVMDEPTSAIDGESEKQISASLERLDEDSILIIVSHRVSVLKGCNRIIVLEDGQMTACGSWGQVASLSTYVQSLSELS